MSKISFDIDRKQVQEGESVTVSWSCESPDMVTLTVVDGVKSVHQLGDSGTRVIPATGNADKIVLTLRASIAGKTEEKTATVKVKRKVVKAERVNSTPYGKKERTGNGSSKNNPINLSRIKNWWQRTKDKYKTAWSYMPETKKLATKILGMMLALTILSSIWPKLFSLGLLLIVGYLGWILIKR